MSNTIKVTPQVYQAIKQDKFSKVPDICKEYDISKSAVSRIRNSVDFDDYRYRNNSRLNKRKRVEVTTVHDTPIKVIIDEINSLREKIECLEQDYHVLEHDHKLLVKDFRQHKKSVKAQYIKKPWIR